VDTQRWRSRLHPRLAGVTIGPPGREETKETMAWIQSRVLVAGSAVGLVALLFTNRLDAETRTELVAICLVALALGVAIGIAWRRLPRFALVLGPAAATTLISLGIVVSQVEPDAVALFYLWIAIYAAYFFTPRQTAAHVAYIGVAFGVALAFTPLQAAPAVIWLLVVGTVAVSAALCLYLSRSLSRRLEEREASERKLAELVSLQSATLESTADGLLVVDLEGRIVSHNRLFQNMWRIPKDILDSRHDERAIDFAVSQLTDPDQFVRKIQQLYSRPRAESYDVLELKDGRVFERYSQPQLGPDERVLGRVWSFRDITDQVQIESQLRHLADHDVLTGLLNRRRFEEEVAKWLAHTARYGGDGAVLLLDIDNFKYVNDSLGHHTGDAVIRNVAALLRDRLRETDVLARVGGDELAILLPEADAKAAAHVAGKLLKLIRDHRPLVRGQRTRITASAGVALITGLSDRTTEQIMVEADIAMYRAKEAGRDRFHVYRQAGASQPAEQARIRPWSDRIREALEKDRFVLHAQPIVDLRSDGVSQYELLVRLVDERGKLLMPAAFLPSAERTGMVAEIDLWVIGEAIRLIAAEERAGRRLRLEINLSGHTLGDPNLVASIESALEQTPIDPGSLIFEVTETAAVVNLDDAREFAQALMPLGCRFALDDFGAGFGSFFYLKYLPLDYLKIDGDFIVNLTSNATDQAVVQAIVELSRKLGKATIAEFVGDEETLELLRAYGVDFVQGFHLGQPQPIEELWETAGRARTALAAGG
jgi:diguanylate cyclase (GGDEF)-like protein/PAS domain S-box-containing protein